jgi:hypothetical protein
LKSRARVTAPLSVLLAVAEGISGMVLMGASLPGTGSLETASRLGIVTAVLVAISSAVHLMKVRARGRGREASEGKRLYAALRYETVDHQSVTGEELSDLGNSSPPGDGGDPPAEPGGDPGGTLS